MRQIIEDEEFERQVRDLGGHYRLDVALDTILNGLMNAPEGFPRHVCGDYSFRYAKTVPINDLPGFTVIFTLDRDGNVYLQQIEEDVPF